MIEQHTIQATPKYNFPQPAINATLPQRFIEQSIHSLRNIQNQTIQLNQQNIQQKMLMQTHAVQLKPQPILLTSRREETTVAAVDTSCMKIGETRHGILIAVRGATVCKQNRKYRYMRIGPFIFHVTEENKKEVYATLQAAYLNASHEHMPQVMLNLMQMPTRIANLLEKWLQITLAKTLNNSLILFDGSLTSGTPDTPTTLMKETLSTAREKGNIILAFSKITNLRFNGHIITEMLPLHKPPYMLEAVGLKPKPPIVLLGDVYVARLTHGNYAFRLDIDKEVSSEQKILAVERLLGNDLFQQSYPETLRLSHILCTFTANEVIAMQHFITRKYGLRILIRPDMHKLLFGPFGRGEGYS